MALKNFLSQLFAEDVSEESVFSETSQEQEKADTLFSFLNDLIVDPQTQKRYRERYENLTSLPQPQRAINAMKLITLYEEFLTLHKPPLTRFELTPAALKEAVQKTIHVPELSKPYQLFFVSETRKILILFELTMQIVAKDMQLAVGDVAWRELFASIVKGNALEGTYLTEREVVFPEEVFTKLSQLPPDILTQEVITFYLSLFQGVAKTLGKRQAEKPFFKLYDFVKKAFPYEIIALLLDFLPEEIFEEEKSAYKSRRELEKIINERTSTLESARKLLEQKVKDLEEARAAALKLLDDIEKEKNKNQLQAQDLKKFQLAVHNALDQVVITDATGAIIYVNPALEQLTGWVAAEVLGKSAMTFWQGVMGQEFSQELWQTISVKKQKFEAEVKSTNKGGQTYYMMLSITPITDEKGEVVFFVSIAHDTTRDKEEKQRIETLVTQRTEQLMQTQGRLSASINSLAIGFIMTDLQSNILTINNTAKGILFTSRQAEIPENTAIDLQTIFKDSLDIKKGIADCVGKRQQIDFTDVDFSSLILKITITPILVAEGPEKTADIIGTVMIIEDITQLKQLERTKNEFFSIASHELRTPLTAIRGNVSLIQQFYSDKVQDKDFTEMMSDIHDATTRLIDIVNDFLDTSRLELGKIEFKKYRITLQTLIPKVIQQYQVTGSRRKLYLNIEAPTQAIPDVVADEDRVRQILINLIGNGLKFTEEGGITIRLNVNGKFVVISVTDTGKGIPKENQKLLFHKFQQAGSSIYTRDVRRGTGLGLYISKLMVEGMGGQIYLERSEEGKGSTFTFTLPVAEGNTVMEVSPAANQTIQQSPIIEDQQGSLAIT